MEKIIILIDFTLILGILILIPYGYLYRSEVMQIKNQIGIAPSKLLDNILKINIWLPLFIFFVALLIAFLHG